MTALMSDPVCEMAIGVRDAVASAMSEGRRFYFCCVRCQPAFPDTPHRYVGWAGDPSRPLRGQDVLPAHAGAMGAATTSPALEPCHFAS